MDNELTLAEVLARIEADEEDLTHITARGGYTS